MEFLIALSAEVVLRITGVKGRYDFHSQLDVSPLGPKAHPMLAAGN